MPDPVTAIIGGGSVIGGLISASGSSSAAKSAAAAQISAADAAAAAELDMYYTGREDMAPWREAGAWAINKLAGTQGEPGEGGYWTEPVYEQQITGYEPYEGLSGGWDSGTETKYRPIYGNALVKSPEWVAAAGGGTAGTPGLIEQGPGEFQESPSYQFAPGEGLKGIERMASATGRLGSGASMKAASRYAEDLASQEYDNFLRRYYQSLDPYFTLAGLGQVSAGQTAQNALATGRGVASSYLSRGEAQAAGQLGGAYPYNALTNYAAGQGLNYAFNQLNQPKNYLTNSQWWGQTPYTPAGVNQMGWL